jgi:hypothetical protein
MAGKSSQAGKRKHVGNGGRLEGKARQARISWREGKVMHSGKQGEVGRQERQGKARQEVRQALEKRKAGQGKARQCIHGSKAR